MWSRELSHWWTKKTHRDNCCCCCYFSFMSSRGSTTPHMTEIWLFVCLPSFCTNLKFDRKTSKSSQAKPTNNSLWRRRSTEEEEKVIHLKFIYVSLYISRFLFIIWYKFQYLKIKNANFALFVCALFIQHWLTDNVRQRWLDGCLVGWL